MQHKQPAEPRAFTTQTAAHLLSMSPEVLRYRIRRGQVRAARIGRHLFVPVVEIDRLLALDSVGESVPIEHTRADAEHKVAVPA